MSNSVNTTRIDLQCAPRSRPAWDFEDTRVVVMPNTLQQVAPTRRIALPATVPAQSEAEATPMPVGLDVVSVAKAERVAPKAEAPIPKAEGSAPKPNILCPPIPPAIPPARRPVRKSYYANQRDLSQVTDHTHTTVDAAPAHEVMQHPYPQTFIARVEGTDIEIEILEDDQCIKSSATWRVLKRCVAVGIVTTVLVGVGFYLGLGANSPGQSASDVIRALLY